MAKASERLRKAARKVAKKTGVAIKRGRKAAKAEIGRRRGGTAARRITEAGTALLAGLAVEQAARAVRARRSRVSPLILVEFEVPLSLDATVDRLADGLRAEGFGILTRIDVHTTLKEKLGATFRPYLILGVCNPSLAHRALAARGETGLVLPCNVTVEETARHTTLVRIADPVAVLPSLSDDPVIHELADEARQRLARAGQAVKSHAGAVVL